MATIFIIHGAFGNPEENWFPWLKQKLEELDYEVIVPRFPTPENQSLKNWNNIFAEYKNKIDDDTIFVGHSLAPAFLLSVLEHINQPIRGAFFISGFLRALGDKTFDSINRTFVDKEFDWLTIKQNCRHFFVYHSDNDPYVPIGCADDLADKLGIEPKIIKDAGHFNKDAGYTKFEILLDDIKSLL